MKKLFPAYFRKTDEELKAIWENCTFILDANVLLDLHRFSTKTEDDFIEFLNKYSDRFWLPHQVALEYLRNRHNAKVENVAKQYVKKHNIEKIRKGKADLESLKFDDEQITSHLSATIKVLKEFETSLPEPAFNKVWELDELETDIIDFFESIVGSPYSTHELESICATARERFIRKQRPGFTDFNDPNKPNPYGDYIIWRQMLDYASQKRGDIIFVTNENKDDWWEKTKNVDFTVGIHPELVQEMYQETGVSLIGYTTKTFLAASEKYLSWKWQETSIVEVEQLEIEQLEAQKQEELAQVYAYGRTIREIFTDPRYYALDVNMPGAALHPANFMPTRYSGGAVLSSDNFVLLTTKMVQDAKGQAGDLSGVSVQEIGQVLRNLSKLREPHNSIDLRLPEDKDNNPAKKGKKQTPSKRKT